MRTSLIAAITLLTLASGCKKKEVESALEAPPPAQDPNSPEAMTSRGAGGAYVDESGRVVAEGVDSGRFTSTDITKRVPMGGYVCDRIRTDSVCVEIAAEDTVMRRIGVDGMQSECAKESGTWGIGTDGALCPTGYISTCTSVGGTKATHYYSSGGNPWTMPTAAGHCGTAGVWTPK